MSFSTPNVASKMTLEDVGPGAEFTKYIPQHEGSATYGVFTSVPYEDTHGDMVANYRLEGDPTPRTGALNEFGITKSPSGEESEYVTVPREE